MNRSVVAVFAVIALAWSVYLLRTSGSEVPVSGSDPAVVINVAPPRVEVADEPPVRIDVKDVIDTSIAFVVSSTSGKALSGAELRQADVDLRSLRKREHVLARSDEDGRASLLPEDLEPAGLGVVLSLAGFADALVIAPKMGCEYQVTLSPEATLRVTVTDTQGHPVEGVLMQVSSCAPSAAVDGAPERPRGVVVGSLNHVVWEVKTGSDGTATCLGLPSATYVASLAGGWVEVEREGDWVSRLEPGTIHEVRVVVARAYAAAVKFVGDELVAWRWEPVGSATSFGGVGLSQLRSRAIREYPDHLVSVLWSKARSSQNVQMRLLAEFRTKGPLEFLIDYVPCDHLQEAVIDVSASPSITNHANVTFEVRDKGGQELTSVKLFAKSDLGRNYPVRSGVARPLPAGRYRLWTLLPAISDLFDSLPLVTVGKQDVVVKCSVDVSISVMKFWLVGLGGATPNKASVLLTAHDGGVISERFIEFSGRKPLAVWVPSSQEDASLTIKVFGYEPYKINDLHDESLMLGDNYINLDPLL